jgi:hypothetical protein
LLAVLEEKDELAGRARQEAQAAKEVAEEEVLEAQGARERDKGPPILRQCQIANYIAQPVTSSSALCTSRLLAVLEEEHELAGRARLLRSRQVTREQDPRGGERESDKGPPILRQSHIANHIAQPVTSSSGVVTPSPETVKSFPRGRRRRDRDSISGTTPFKEGSRASACDRLDEAVTSSPGPLCLPAAVSAGREEVRDQGGAAFWRKVLGADQEQRLGGVLSVVQFTADPDEANYRLGLEATRLGANLNSLVSAPVAFLNNLEANLFGEAKDGGGR